MFHFDVLDCLPWNRFMYFPSYEEKASPFSVLTGKRLYVSISVVKGGVFITMQKSDVYVSFS